jgi:beta-phosphoglucomutase-like phosphatase (HAD superfamily)
MSVPFKIRNTVATQTAWLSASGASIGAPEDGWLPGDFDDAVWVREALEALRWECRVPKDASPETLLLKAPDSKKGQERLIHAIACALAPEAIFLSVDGVILDVHKASLSALKKAGESFGVKLHEKKIQQAFPIMGDPPKCLAELLKSAGKSESMKAIRKAYDTAYLGSRSKPGTRQQEKRIPPREWLDELVEWIPLGVISSRKEGAVKSMLERFELTYHIDTSVSGGKGAYPPEPDLPKQALKKMGIERAWWVVAHPDEATAARRAGLIPIGIIPPGVDKGLARRALEGAGVARIIKQLKDLKDRWP